MPVESLRQKIVDAAIALTAENGWASVTMSQVADAVGVSRQTIYNEVGTKPALAEAMVQGELTSFLIVVEQSFDAHPVDARAAIESAVLGVLELAQGNTLLRTIVSATHGSADGTATELLPLLTTDSEQLIAASSFVIAQRLSTYQMSVGPLELQMAVDAIVRLTLSHVMSPGATPQKTAAQIGGLAELLLATPSAELEAQITVAGSR
jgi:AcrR family transcriptional regulator